MRIRDLAATVGITERATQQIVRDLEADSYLSVRRIGRRNVYSVRKRRPLRHHLQRGHTVGHLLEALPIAFDSKRGRSAISPKGGTGRRTNATTLGSTTRSHDQGVSPR